uniref:Envelope small membrane protein n=1 Tax=Porcine epidemic diarrhea virus TaxID=28295 RepID=I1TLD2_PEDV|nr:envelope protein [Porcine epidemic diarrhea virus]AOM53010.1 envelope protein [Porcine epidemic diarrhea virus]AOM53017.1 envelope protein [Porcine epidemic diarrhea virus]QHQ97046.1 envelope protein [Porcine epidemic diarrhea virus]QMU85396.1 mutant envelope protein [Porcine epidemic diarrhea virus]
MLQLVNDNGLAVNVILWLFVLFTFVQLVNLCFTCHRLCNSAVYTPIGRLYRVYKSYMRIDPLPSTVIDI